MITGWAAILLTPILMPLALVASLWPGKKTVDRTPEEVVGFLRDFLEGTGGDWDWDEFETVPITDPELDGLRKRAALAAPPNPDFAELGRLLAEAETMVKRRRVALQDLRTELMRILDLEEQSPVDWSTVEARCLGLLVRLNRAPTLPYPRDLVGHFLDDPDIRRKDFIYAEMQRQRLKRWLSESI